MAQLVLHVHPVRDAGAVGDHQGHPAMGLSLGQGLHRLRRVCPHGDLSHVDVPVGHGDLAEILLPGRLSARGELGDRRAGRRLRRLAAGVRVHLGVHHQDVDVPSGREHMVQAAEADVIGPTVSSNDPNTRLDQSVGDTFQTTR